MMKSYVSPLALVLLVLTVGTAVAGFVLIPAGTSLPVHWGMSGEADSFASREVALAMPIAIILAIWAVFFAIERFAPKVQVERSRAMSRAALTMLTAIFLCIAVVTVLIGIGIAVNMVRALAIGVGLLLVAVGNAMPKSQPNGFAGIRIRTTLADPANWQQTHRLTGLLTIIGGAVLVLVALLVPVPVLIWAILACVIVPLAAGVFYSLRLARRQAS
jgi:uncharacterized membrane protein